MPDHSNIFSLLLSKLETVSPHTSLVAPGLNLRSLVTQVLLGYKRNAVCYDGQLCICDFDIGSGKTKERTLH